MRVRFSLIVLRFALAGCAAGGPASLARAGSSDWDAWSLFVAIPAAEQPRDSRLRAQVPAEPEGQKDAAEAPQASFGVLSGAPDSENFFGDLGGLRTALGRIGLTLSISEYAEMFGNVTGGAERGFSGNGENLMQLDLDTKRAFGFEGGTFHVSGLHIWGGNLSETNLLALQTLTGIEADRSLRLWELWYDQKLGDAFDVKVGQQAIDGEFMVSPSAGYFLNSAMGWGRCRRSICPAAALPIRSRTSAHAAKLRSTMQ